MIELVIPYTKTGPATLNILLPRPSIKPSLLNSIAGATILFANPVIGIVEPAPAILPNLEYRLIAVKKALKNINDILVIVDAVSLSTYFNEILNMN